MIRKQLYIEKRQEDMLRERARSLGMSEAAIIRAAIDMAMGSSIWPWQDTQAWREAREYMKARQRLEAPQTGRTWTRDDLYSD